MMMPDRHRLSALFDRLRANIHLLWERLSATDDLPFSAVSLQYQGRTYRAEAHARYVSIERLEDGHLRQISTDDGAEHFEMAREAFDGFEWDLTTLMELIDLDEGLRS